jgi:hypothetical protein
MGAALIVHSTSCAERSSTIHNRFQLSSCCLLASLVERQRTLDRAI